MENNVLTIAKQLFEYYKQLGEKAIHQIENDELLAWNSHESNNSIVQIVRHLSGNMISRWTDFLTSDGEKPNRDRDDEFESYELSKAELLLVWNKGWNCLFSTLDQLDEADLTKTVYIRNQGHTVQEAIMRQVAHYAYHVGQIVYLSKFLLGEQFESLSIPKHNSAKYNEAITKTKNDHNFFTNDWVEK